jgi:hypothetical protein
MENFFQNLTRLSSGSARVRSFQDTPERVQRGEARVALSVQALAGDHDAPRERRGQRR